jgi:L-threonylcarbamoyladenylate synthase
MAGRVIIFPTDTVYGIGTKIRDLDGIERIYQIKHRPKEKPLVCLCASLEQIKEIAEVDMVSEKLIQKFLPGGFTLILKSKDEIKNLIGYPTIEVRIPKHERAIKILEENGPMLTTSVNESGSVPLNEYDEIVKEYAGLVDKIYNTTTESMNKPSTVVLVSDGVIKILREGPVSKEEIEVFLKL